MPQPWVSILIGFLFALLILESVVIAAELGDTRLGLLYIVPKLAILFGLLFLLLGGR